MDRVGVLPLSNDSASSSDIITPSNNIITPSNNIITPSSDIITPSNNIQTDISSSGAVSISGLNQQKYLIYTDDAAPIIQLISELTELKTAVADIKARMTCVPVDNLIDLNQDSSDRQPISSRVSDDIEANILKRSKVISSIPSTLPTSVLPPTAPSRAHSRAHSSTHSSTHSNTPTNSRSIEYPRLTIQPERLVQARNPLLARRNTLFEIVVGVALFGLLGAAVLSLSIIDEVLAEYCVISLYALNKFYVMYISNNTYRYTKCVFMLMAASLLIESTFLITSLFRLLDKPSHVYSSIAALIDIGISWALARL